MTRDEVDGVLRAGNGTLKSVVVEDFFEPESGKMRRRFVFENPVGGGRKTLEVDAATARDQIASLVRNLPVVEGRRASLVAALGRNL